EVFLEVTVTVVKPDPTGVTISGPAAVVVGQTGTYTAAVDPSLALQGVTWSTSDATKATITSAGVLTGVAAGTIKVRATSVKTSVYSEMDVTISAPDPESLTVSGDPDLIVGETATYTAAVLPVIASQAVTWSTSDAALATITSAGVLSAVGAGVVEVIATSVAKDTVVGRMDVTIIPPDPTIEFVLNGGEWTLSSSDLLYPGEPITTISPAVLDETASGYYVSATEGSYLTHIFLNDANKNMSPSVWQNRAFLNKNAAGFYEVKLVLVAGSANVNPDLSLYEYYIFAHSGYKAGYDAIAALQVGQVIGLSGFDIKSIDQGILTGGVLNVYQANNTASKTLVQLEKDTVLPIPYKAEHRFIGWYANAEFTGDAVTVVNESIKLYAKFEEILPASIEISGDEFLDVAGTATYTAAVLPAGSNQGITWSTSDVTIATIDETTGVLTAVKAGSVKVIATSTKTNTITGEFNVMVYGEPTAIAYDGPTEFVVGGTGQAIALVSAATGEVADASAVTYSIDAAAVATINANTGVISALSAGTATVTITSTIDNLIVGTQLITVYAAEHVFTTTTYIVSKDFVANESFICDAYSGTFVIGYNAFNTVAEALTKVVANDAIYVMAGTYEEDVTISISNISILGANQGVSAFVLTNREEESIIKGTITLGDVEGITLDGLQISGGQIRSTATLKDIVLKNLYFVDSNVSASEGVIFFGLAAGADVNDNVQILNSYFDDNKGTGYRGVRINNAQNLTISNNYFVGYFDTIRLEGHTNSNSGDGVRGNLVIEHNVIVGNTQYPIYLTVWSATSVEINYNNIGVDPAGTGTYGFMYLRNYVPKEGVKSVVNIQYNEFPYNTEWHEIRLNTTGATAAQLEVNVNYNIFHEIPWSDDTDQCTHIADHSTIASDFVVNGVGNFFKYDSEVKSTYFLKTTYEPYYRSEEELEDLFVDDAWVGKVNGEVVESESIKYIYGLNAFATITEALAVADNGTNIYVLPGTYNEQVEITKLVNLYGPNAAINPVDDDAVFLATSETAAIITGVWYLNTVTAVEIKGFSFTGASRVRMFGPSGDAYGFVFENNYVYDTNAATLAWKEAAYSSYGISTINDVLTPGFLNLVPYARWLHNFEIVNNKFVNVSDTNVFALCVAGITIEGNYFKDGDRDAIRFDYGSVYGDVNVMNNHFENIALNGVYFRSYTGTYTTALNANIHNNYFKNVGSNAATAASAKIAAISTRGYAEKKDAYFDIRYNVFEDCYNYIAIRANVTNSTTWAAGTIVWQATIEYNAFIDADPVTFYFQNRINASDSAATNVDNVIINYNYYGIDATTKATIAPAQFDLYKADLSNLVVYDTLALLDSAIAEQELVALKVDVAALAEGKTAEYPAVTLDAFITGHGFSGYTLTHNGKVLFIGYNAYIPLRAMLPDEVVLPWQVVQPYTTGEAFLVNYGLNLAGPVAAGGSPTGTGVMYHNVNDTNVVVNSNELYGYQGTAWGQGLYGVILVGSDGVVKTNFAAADLAAGVVITLEPGDFLITSFQSDRAALVTCYGANADFAVGQTVVIECNLSLRYGG
ncbi:MAG: Ig-like domain-containing protein, partial [Bacilli bacterium]